MLTKMFKMMKKGNKGFTLVELMVVVVIIGVLTAIAVPVYNNVTEKARINAIASNLRIINGAVSQYLTDKGSSATAPSSSTLVPNYIQTWPTGPKGVTYNVQKLNAAGDAVDAAGTLQGVAVFDTATSFTKGTLTLDDESVNSLAQVQKLID